MYLKPHNGNNGRCQRLCGGVKAALGRPDVFYAVEEHQIGDGCAEDDDENHCQHGGGVPVACVVPRGMHKVHHEAQNQYRPPNQEHCIIFCQKAHRINRIKRKRNGGKRPPE